MDVVICLALKECLFFNKNLHFINKNLNPSNVYVITDCRNFRYITKKYRNVKLIDENKLLDSLNFKRVKHAINRNKFKYKSYGWYFQQFLKIGFALSKYANEEYLVWDADTVPLNPIELKKNDKYLFFPKWEHNEPYFSCMDKLFDLPQKANYSFISEHMVFNVKIIKEMIRKIQVHDPYSEWFEICLNAVNPNARSGFSEFETYGTYCLNYYPNIMVPHNLRTFRHCAKIYGITASQKEIESLSNDFDTGSFEINDFPLSLLRRIKQVLLLYFCKIISKYRIARL